LRKQTDFKKYRSIFGEEKTMRREESSVIPGGRRIIKEWKTELNGKEEKLSSFIEPGSMVWSQPHTEMQFVTQANQSEVESARRFEVSKVEAL
jgi:hypothetical protein